MPLTTRPCQKYIDVVHKQTSERRPATVRTDGVVVDKNGTFDETTWTTSQLPNTDTKPLKPPQQ